MPTHKVPLLGIAGLLALVMMVVPARVTLGSLPGVMMGGGTLVVRCRVPKDPANRLLILGLADIRTSYVELEGERAATQHELIVQHVPCGEVVAYCALIQRTDKDRQYSDSRSVEVLCQ